MKTADKHSIRNIKNQNWDPSTADAVWWLLDNTKSAVSRLRDMEVAAIGLTPEQATVLTILVRSGNSTITEIADFWLRQRNSVSTLVDRMSKQGLVKKSRQANHKEIEIEITPKGRELQSKITRSTINQVFEVLSLEDRQKLAQYLKLLSIRSRSLLGAPLDFYFLV